MSMCLKIEQLVLAAIYVSDSFLYPVLDIGDYL